MKAVLIPLMNGQLVKNYQFSLLINSFPSLTMSLHSNLSAIQSELNVPKGRDNKFGGFKYRSCEDILDAVKPLLKKHNCVLTITDDIVMLGTRFYVKATATVSVVGSKDESLSVSALAREVETKTKMDEAQITGAASSYARKYALNGLFCIDDTKDADTMDNTKASGALPYKTPHDPTGPTPKPVEKKKPTLEMVNASMAKCTVPSEVETTWNSAMKYAWTDAEALQINEMKRVNLNRVLPV